MKKLLFTSLGIFILTCASGQDLIEKISKQICNCVDTIESMDSLEAKLDRCIPDAVLMYFESNDEDDYNEFADDDTISKTMDAVIQNLGYYCPKLKKYVLADRESQFYKDSESSEANEFYHKGSDAYKSQDYKNAEKFYVKALKADPQFIYAYDDLALTYRKQGEYKKAIKFYDKSLEIYPQGSYALQNQAVAYLYLKEYANAMKNYDKLMNLYPDNPEGFFGTARVYLMMEEYEKALDYAFYSHKMYLSLKSDYAKDSEDLIKLIYNKLKEQNKLDIFNKEAAKFGFN